MSSDLKKVFNKAKIGLISGDNSTFITTILFSMNHVWTDRIPTAGVDGINLFINPDWFCSLTEKARIGLLAHETWHVAFDHISRSVSYDHKKYNKAADYVINLMLDNTGFELPPKGLLDSKYRGMSTEDVYKLLPDTPPQPSNSPGGNSGSGDDDGYDCDIVPADANGATPEEIAKKKFDIQGIIIKAATQSKMSGDAAGTIPGDIARLIDELINPKLHWGVIFRNYMTAFSKNDYTFKRPNRRFMPEFYLPSLYSENMNDLALAFDSSGSVTGKEFSAYYGETKTMRQIMKPKKTTIIDFDTRINNVYILEEDQSMDDCKFGGGGGTNLRPVFKHFEKNPPTILVVFSDLECSPITKDPGYPVVWIAVNSPRAQVNFGTLIHYTTGD